MMDIESRLKALEADAPTRGTWADADRIMWQCQCVDDDDGVLQTHHKTWAMCSACYTLRPRDEAPRLTCTRCGRCGPAGDDWTHVATEDGGETLCVVCGETPDSPAPDVATIAAMMRGSAEGLMAPGYQWRGEWHKRYGDGYWIVDGHDAFVVAGHDSTGPVRKHIVAACPANVLVVLNAYERTRNGVTKLAAERDAAIRDLEAAQAECCKLRSEAVMWQERCEVLRRGDR